MDYIHVLKTELDRRRAQNASYSLRAFSFHLKMSPAQLCQLLSGKRPLTAKAALKIAERLGLSPIEKASLLESTLRVAPVDASSTIEVKEEEFRLIADWYHFAILSLAELRNHRSDPRWIASQLGITVQQAAEAVARMRKLNIIDIQAGKIQVLGKYMRTTTEVPSSAIRLYHKQTLDKAKQKIDEVGLADREYSTITSAVSRKNIPKAKKMITDFKRKLSALLEAGDKEAVYTLAIQLFPVSKLEEK